MSETGSDTTELIANRFPAMSSLVISLHISRQTERHAVVNSVYDGKAGRWPKIPGIRADSSVVSGFSFSKSSCITPPCSKVGAIETSGVIALIDLSGSGNRKDRSHDSSVDHDIR
jgi:hypothetical protein